MAVDEFHGRLQGLVLAEVELTEADTRLTPLPFAVADFTDDDRFSGGALAFASNDVVNALLQEVAQRRGE